MYPSANDAPKELKELSGPCGPISVWMVLKRHGIDIQANEIIGRSRYTEEHGTFLISMAGALMDFGLKVSFYSDYDPEPKPIEQEEYAKLHSKPALPLTKLLGAIDQGASVIVSYLAYGGDGHFSPMAGAKANKLILPYSIEGMMLKSVFVKRWRANGILRQSIIAT